MLPPKLLLPPYTAVIECAPAVRAGVANVATPELLSVPVPRVVAPSLKVTLPVGVPPGPVTVAVKVTTSPNVLGFGDDDNVVEVNPVFTVWFRAEEVLPKKLLSPPYAAVIE